MSVLVENRERSLTEDARAVAWWVLVGAGSGAIAGFLVGGVGGRLAMLLLRLTSPDVVRGVISDDGFEIGVVSARTLQLFLAMTMLGAGAGITYAAVRGAIPRRLRVPAWTLFTGVAGGASIVHREGVDFTLLEPAVLAVALFVALPALGGLVAALLVERWARLDPAEHRHLLLGLVVAALAGTFALLVGVGVGAVALLLRRRHRLGRVVADAARVVVPAGLTAVIGLAAVDLAGDVAAIL
jgi:hypothetical protein